ncbi:MAG: DUF4190 domain-containing protein [bacterium]|nr:DUF4190 domain-containing protein [bacterium]
MAKEVIKKPTSAVTKSKPAAATKTVEYQPATDAQDSGDHPIAITSMILGVVSLTALGPISGIPAVILGIIGLNKSPKKGLSIAGIVTGGASIIITFIVVAMLFLLFIAGGSPVEYNQAPIQPSPLHHTVYNET